MGKSVVFIVGVVYVALASAASTSNPITGMTSLSTDIITEIGTTILDNSTTLPSTKASSTQPAPTPCAVATWMVRQTDGNVCQLMSFSGTITYTHANEEQVMVDIPENATVLAKSGCAENGAFFALSFELDNKTWEIDLSFTKDGSKYYLGRVSLTISAVDGASNLILSDEGEFFFVPVGEHYMCNTLDFDLEQNEDQAEIKLLSPVLQPFVQLTEDGCGLGGAHECSSGEKSNTGLIVGCVLGGVAVVAAGGMTFYVIRKKKRNNYSNIR